eukprot:comp18015_c0_seq1/m.18498 comp18015_c0_seq1/g.18498  ORF comp18015_c0_seq1/g.18498 comp18015_c0_seq1/m.18498 type:complete len:136 (-) comp18015_c0_seq1:498-905(-)
MDIKPELDQLGVKLVAIGTGNRYFANQFISGLPFSGEVYLDPEAKSFQALKLPRWGMLSTLWRFVKSLAATNWYNENAKKYATANMEGDGQQSGGIFVVSQKGEIVFSFKEDEQPPEVFCEGSVVLAAVKKLLGK